MKVKPGMYLVAVSVVTSFVMACTTQNPNRPTMSFVAPQASQPANGASYNFNQQPITLAITNVVRTGSETVTYSVEVARDTGFANKVFNRDGIAENPSGTTSVALDPLTVAASTYYWRWKAVVNGIAGEPSNSQNFFLKPNIVLNPPQLLAPASAATINVPRPTFTVVNSTFQGNPGVDHLRVPGVRHVELLVAHRVGVGGPADQPDVVDAWRGSPGRHDFLARARARPVEQRRQPVPVIVVV